MKKYWQLVMVHIIAECHSTTLILESLGRDWQRVGNMRTISDIDILMEIGRPRRRSSIDSSLFQIPCASGQLRYT
jgi:hypothetical protein